MVDCSLELEPVEYSLSPEPVRFTDHEITTRSEKRIPTANFAKPTIKNLLSTPVLQEVLLYKEKAEFKEMMKQPGNSKYIFTHSEVGHELYDAGIDMNCEDIRDDEKKELFLSDTTPHHVFPHNEYIPKYLLYLPIACNTSMSEFDIISHLTDFVYQSHSTIEKHYTETLGEENGRAILKSAIKQHSSTAYMTYKLMCLVKDDGDMYKKYTILHSWMKNLLRTCETLKEDLTSKARAIQKVKLSQEQDRRIKLMCLREA